MDTLKRLQIIMSETGSRHRYQLVGGVDQAMSSFQKRSSRSKSIIVGTSTLIALLLLYVFGHASTSSPEVARLNALQRLPAHFQLLMTAPHRDLNLCKSLVSAAALGYPSAALAGWEEPNPKNGSDSLKSYSLVKRAEQIHDHLNTLKNDDMVVIADGTQTWFQLRPQLLLDRYHEIIGAANKRVKRELGAKTDIHQQIIFSSQRTCGWQGAPDDSYCYAMPESTVSPSTFGSESSGSEADQAPRFLNGAFVMGPVKAMRNLYAEIIVRMNMDSSLQSHHAAFGRVFAEQTIYRALTSASGSWLGGLSSGDSSPTARFKPADIEAVKSRNRPLEFGITLDYNSATALTTSPATNANLAWLTFNDESRIYTANEVLNIPQSQSKINEINPDILDTLPPYWTFSEEGLPRSAEWTKIPLMTNVRTGVSPAVIQVAGQYDEVRQKWWRNIWFQKHARQMYNAHIWQPLGPIAIGPSEEPREYWPVEEWKGGARTVDGEWLRYDIVCNGTEDKVFGDGKGAWVLPANH